MDLKQAVLRIEHKDEVLDIVEYIGTNPLRFEALMQLFFDEDWRICQRASWVVSHCTDRHIALIHPYIGAMAHNLQQANHDAVKRNTIRIFQSIDIPEAHFGEVVDLCFRYLANPQEAIAIRVFSMTVLHNACKREPDLSRELSLLIQEHMPEGSAGFKSRGRKILKALEKMY